MKKSVTASGQLRHHFWGEYSATIILVFDDEGDATEAAKELNRAVELKGDVLDACGRQRKSRGWTQADKQKRVVAIHVGGEDLKKVEEHLIVLGADRRKIGSLAKSIDSGEPFDITIPIEVNDPNQLTLQLQ